MRAYLRWIAAAGIVLAAPLHVLAQARESGSGPEDYAELEAAINQEGLVGAVWATVTPDGIATGAAGLADARTGQRMTTSVRVHTGSVVKTLIATGILRLVTEEKLALDSPVEQLLPDVVFENPWASSHPVLLRHLLDHTSGLDDARFWQVFSLRAEADAPLSDGLPGRPLRVRSRPGSRLSYSNLGYTLLGLVVERVTGERYEQYLDAHLLRPLGMHESTFQFTSQEGPDADVRLAMGHFEKRTAQPAVPMFLRPAGQFTTVAHDMGLFARFLMGNGEVDGVRFIEPELLRAMGRPTTTEAVSAGLIDAGYGLGMATRDRHGTLGKCHSGTTVGFRANLCIFPEEQTAFFIAMNADVDTADYERFDSILIRELDIARATPTGDVAPPEGIEDWQGVYVLAPNRTEHFAYVDLVLNFAIARWDGRSLHLKPLQSTERTLLPVGDRLFRAEDRTRASHVLYVSDEGRRVIGDGVRSYEQASLWRMVPYWTSLLAGLLGLAYVILLGAFRLVRGRLKTADPLFVPFVASLALFLPVPMFYGQSFLRLGDLTAASAMLAFVTGVLPLAMLYGLLGPSGRRSSNRGVATEKLAMLGVVQWTVVLFLWGLLPLRLWT